MQRGTYGTYNVTYRTYNICYKLLTKVITYVISSLTYNNPHSMTRPESGNVRPRTPRSANMELVIYEFQQQSLTSTIDPTLTRKEFRETIGALMDISSPSRNWDNFETHQVRPLPTDYDPLYTMAFIFVHPMTLAHGMSFVLVTISVTYETAVCGRFETTTERAVHKVPAHTARQTFLVNVRIWELCTITGRDQCEVRLPDRIWEPDDLINRLIFDGAHVQISCTTPYHDIPLQQQLREAQNGRISHMINEHWGQANTRDHGITLFQHELKLTKRAIPRTEFTREPTAGLRPPGNPQLDTLDKVVQDPNGEYIIADDVPEKKIQLSLADALQIPRPLVRTSTQFAMDNPKNDFLKVPLGQGPDLYRSMLDFDPEGDQPWHDWHNVPDLLPCVREGLSNMPSLSFEQWDIEATQAIEIHTDGSMRKGKISWACAFFIQMNETWFYLGYHLGELPEIEGIKQNSLAGELFALLYSSWWTLRITDAFVWRGQVFFNWDSTVAGYKAQGSFSTTHDRLGEALRHVQQALESTLGNWAITHNHVYAHKGHWPNEFVDGLAKWATEPGAFASPTEAIAQILAINDSPLGWLWLHVIGKNDTLPQLQHGELQWQFRPEQSPVDLDHVLRTAMPMEEDGERTLVKTFFKLRIGSYNCLSLDSHDEASHTDNTHSLMNRIGLLRQQSDELGFHVLGIQESRTEAGQTKSRTHIRVSSGKTAEGTLGVELWLSLLHPFGYTRDGIPIFFKPQYLAVVWATPRILIVNYDSGNFQIIFVVAHALHQGYGEQQREEWWQSLEKAMTPFSNKDAIFLIDANARITQEFLPHFGNVTEGPMNKDGTLLKETVARLSLFAPSTFEHWHFGDVYTWHHPDGIHTSRLDYILLPLSWRTAWMESWVEEAIHSGRPVQDHLCAALDVAWTDVVKRPKGHLRSFDHQAISDPQNSQLLGEIWDHAPTISWDTNATAHAAQLTDYLQTKLREHFPRSKKLKTCRIASEETMDLYHTLTNYRRSLKVYKKASCLLWLRFWFDVWRSKLWSDEDIRWANTLLRYHALAMAGVPQRARELTKQIRIDKRNYVNAVAKEAANARPHEVYQMLKPIIPHKTKRTGPGPMTRLLKLDGTLTTSPEEVADRWTEHFALLEAGHVVDPKAFLRQALSKQNDTCRPTNWYPSDLPTLTDLEAAIRRTRARKAVGPDGLPNEIFKVHTSKAARVLSPLLYKSACRIEEPVQFKGGSLIALFKGRGNFDNCSSFRGILLLSTIGKLMRASMRSIVNTPYVNNSDHLQLAGKPAQQVLFGAELVRHFLQWQKQERRSAAVIFCDVTSAFYKAVREMALGADCSDLDIAQLAKRLQLGPEAMHLLHDSLAGNHSYHALEASAAQEAYLRESLTSTWFISNHTRLVATERGTRPGDAWADIVFNILFSQVLSQIGEVMKQRGALLELTSSTNRTLWPSDGDPQACVPLYHTTWADDLALLLCINSNDRAENEVADATSVLLETLHQRGMTVTLGKGKTEILLLLRGPGAQQARRRIFSRQDPAILVLEEGGTSVVPLTPSYKHLGGILTADCTMVSEIRARTTKAKAMFWQLAKPVFRCKHLPFDTKRDIFRGSVLSIYIWGTGAWPDLSRREQNLFESGLWLLYRWLMPHRTTPENATPHSQLELLEMLQLPHPEDLLHEARARHLASLVRVAPQGVWAVLHKDQLALRAYRAALQWMWTATSRDKDLPGQDDWSAWMEFMLTHPNKWKTLCRRAAHRHLAHRILWMKVATWQRDILTMLDEANGSERLPPVDSHAHRCLVCSKFFSTGRAWFLHAFGKHGYRSLPGRAAKGRYCPRCQKVYRGTLQLQHHLRYSRECCLYFWNTCQEDLPNPTIAGSDHPQCPWMHVPGDSPYLEARHGLTDDSDLREELQDFFRHYTIPDEETDLTQSLYEALQQILTVVLPLKQIREVWNQWMNYYADSPDVNLREALTRVTTWLYENTQDTVADSVQHARHQPEEGQPRNFDVSVPAPQSCFKELLVIHLYSGRRRRGDLQQCFEQLQLPDALCLTVLSVDVAVDENKCDLMSPQVQTRWLHLIASGVVAAVISGPPCETWSVARFRNEEKLINPPRPLRFRNHLWGLCDTNKSEMKQVNTGNTLMGFSLRALVCQALRGGFAVLEHPDDPLHLPNAPSAAPSIWFSQVLRWILQIPQCCLLRVSQGYYNAQSAKPTGLLLAGMTLAEAESIAKRSRTTPLPTTGTIGRSNGKWRTAALKEYPEDFCRMLSKLFLHWVSKRSDLPRVPLSTDVGWLRNLSVELDQREWEVEARPDFHRSTNATN